MNTLRWLVSVITCCAWLVAFSPPPLRAAYSFNGSSQYLSATDAAVTAAPLTLAIWFRATNTTTNGALLQIANTANTNRFLLYAGGATAGDPVVGTINTTTFETTTSFSSSVWQHACATFTSSTSRAVYLNGSGKQTNTSNVTPAGITTTEIGARTNSGTPGLYFNGQVAMAAIWNIALSDEEVAALCPIDPITTAITPVSPLLHSRAGNLVRYWPLLGDLRDLLGGIPLTPHNSPPLADHPTPLGR